MDSMSALSEAMLPEWLRAEWVEPVVVRGERLGAVVVLPGPSATTGLGESLVTGASSGRRADDSFAVASIAHEVKQPLTAVVATAGGLLRGLKHEPPNLAAARGGLERMRRGGQPAREIRRPTRGVGARSPTAKQPA